MRFKKNSKFLSDYKVFMEDVLDNYAERVPLNRLDVEDGKINYVPHTGIYHPKKPGRIRVVFDCSARFNGISLNDHLLQGPDQTNNLLGILCRFRQERIAFLTDIKGMFHQLMVSEEYGDLLRFLWWKDGDPTNDVVEYRMKVHLFGAASSPGCANFGLKRAADKCVEINSIGTTHYLTIYMRSGRNGEMKFVMLTRYKFNGVSNQRVLAKSSQRNYITFPMLV
jgi:hypothetical protein